jgi:hypothetical protein
MSVRINTASGIERTLFWVSIDTARGTDPASLPARAIANLSIELQVINFTKIA